MAAPIAAVSSPTPSPFAPWSLTVWIDRRERSGSAGVCPAVGACNPTMVAMSVTTLRNSRLTDFDRRLLSLRDARPARGILQILDTERQNDPREQARHPRDHEVQS